jgi:hypothetical protein
MTRKTLIILIALIYLLIGFSNFLSALFPIVSPGTAGLGIQNHLGEITYRLQSPYVYQGFVLVLIVGGLLTILFLSQRETRAIFVPAETSDRKPDIFLEE